MGRVSPWSRRDPLGLELVAVVVAESLTPTPLARTSGGRICIGRRIAHSEMCIFIANTVLGWDLTLRKPDEVVRKDLALGVSMKRGMGEVAFKRAD